MDSGLGLVLAGLAILVVFLDPEYLKVLDRAEGGVEADMFPFWWTAALAVGAVVSDAIVLLVFAVIGNGGRRICMFATTWLFLWTLLATLNLVAFVAGHGTNRAHQILHGHGHDPDEAGD